MKRLSYIYLLRKQANGDYLLYNKINNNKYTITPKLFEFLYLFKYNNIDINSIFDYFKRKNIEIQDLISFCQKEEFKNLFVDVENNNHHSLPKDNIYHHLSLLSPYTEYTPEKIDFLITKHCNLNCKHCFENASSTNKISEIDTDSLFDFFDQMDYLNVKTLKITGGEPLSHPNIDNILEKIGNCRFECVILTNGMLLTEKLIDLIKNSNTILGISLDGITPESHDYIRGKGSFAILQNKLSLLKRAGVSMGITVSVNTKNFLELEDIARYAIESLGVRNLYINQLKPLGRARINNDIFLSESQYLNVIDLVNNLEKQYGNIIQLSDDALADDYNASHTHSTGPQTPLYCAAGNTSLSIDEKLDVYPCVYGNDFEQFKMGDLKSQTLLDIWQSNKWGIFRGQTVLENVKGCVNCKNNAICNMKNCRLKPVYDGQDFYSHISYCAKLIKRK